MELMAVLVIIKGNAMTQMLIVGIQCHSIHQYAAVTTDLYLTQAQTYALKTKVSIHKVHE